MRRLPVYLLIETAGGMKGERIEAVKNGLQVLVSRLRQDPFALESVYISIIRFDYSASEVLPLTSLETLQIPDIEILESRPPHTGEALRFLCQKVDENVMKGTTEEKGDWRPLVFILTRGVPADKEVFREVVPLVKSRNFAALVACTAGSHSADDEMKMLTEHVVHLDTADSATLASFFKWVSSSVSTGSVNTTNQDELVLPLPPPEVQPIL